MARVMRVSGGVRQADLLEGLSPEEQELVWSHATQRVFPKGSFLYHEGDPADIVYLAKSGRVRLFELTDDGREVLVTFLYPGEIFGGLIAGESYRATARTDSSAQIYAWRVKTLKALMTRFPRLQENLLELTKYYFYFSRDRYRLLATASVERRIGWALAYLAEKIGRSKDGVITIASSTLQKDLADLASTTIYTVNRTLSEWERRGVLSKKRGSIVLLRQLRQKDFV